MNAFFTKKQKNLMRERKKKRKRALLKTADDDETNNCPPAVSENTEPAKAAAKAAATSSSSSSEPNKTTKRPRLVVHQQEREIETAKPNNSKVIIIVSARMSSKEAKKFRKDERRKARQQGREVEFATANSGSSNNNKINESWVSTNEPTTKEKQDLTTSSPRKPQQSKRHQQNFPRINDLVQQAKEQQALDQKRQEVSNDEETLTDSYKQRYLALDCEMVGTGSEGKQSALARVSIVDWNGAVVFDTFVQVPSRVVDFRTQFSGIKPKHIKKNDGNAMKPEAVRERVAALANGKIIVGHALHNDFKVLMLQHPKSDIRDTAKYRPFQRYHLKWRPRKLRDLVHEHLGKTIQVGSHDSTVDAASTMELFRLVRKEWEGELEEKASKKGKNKRI